MSDGGYLLFTMAASPLTGLRASVSIIDCRKLTDDQRLRLACGVSKAVEKAIDEALQVDVESDSKSGKKPLSERVGVDVGVRL